MTTNTSTQRAKVGQREEMYIQYYTLSTYYKCRWFIEPFSAEFHTKLKPNQKKLINEGKFLLSVLLPLPLNSTSVYAIRKVQLTMRGTHQLLGYTEMLI